MVARLAYIAALALLPLHLAAAQQALPSQVVASSEKDAFSTVDANHDGSIDRTEWTALEKNDKEGWLGSLSGAGRALKQDISSFAKATYSSLSMILATEVGDRTFCIAAIMAMRYARLTVFAGAIGALALMTVLSSLIGVALPTFLPHTYTHYAAACLFVYFGLRLLKDASSMSSGAISEELAETEEELGIHPDKAEGAQQAEQDGASAPVMADADDDSAKSDLAKVRARMGAGSSGGGGGGAVGGGVAGAGADADGFISALGKEWPVFSQAFTLTFLAEWGDRSQIATIAMAAAQDPYGGG